MLKNKGIIVGIFALTASLPIMVDYNIAGDELLLYLGKIYEHLGVGINATYRIFVLIVNLLTAAFAYMGLSKNFENKTVGIMGSSLYTLLPYRLNLIYGRSALGEYLAMTLLPLVVCGLYGIFFRSRKGYLWNATLFFAGVVGVAFCYAVEIRVRKLIGSMAENHMLMGIGSALLLCLLVWIGILIIENGKILPAEEKKQQRIGNALLLIGVIILCIAPMWAGVAYICLIFTACISGLRLFRYEGDVFSGKTIAYAFVLLAMVVGTYEVNHILLNSGEIIRTYMP